jgi:hypothetical protein
MKDFTVTDSGLRSTPKYVGWFKVFKCIAPIEIAAPAPAPYTAVEFRRRTLRDAITLQSEQFQFVKQRLTFCRHFR